MKELRSWKKVYESDLESLIYELQESTETPMVLILSGDLGAGKTTFSKYFIESLNGESDKVGSPTYSLVQEIRDILHADFYRLEDPEDILHLELPLYLEDKNYFLIEWGKKWVPYLKRELPDNFNVYELDITINPQKEGESAASRNYFLYELDID